MKTSILLIVLAAFNNIATASPVLAVDDVPTNLSTREVLLAERGWYRPGEVIRRDEDVYCGECGVS